MNVTKAVNLAGVASELIYVDVGGREAILLANKIVALHLRPQLITETPARDVLKVSACSRNHAEQLTVRCFARCDGNADLFPCVTAPHKHNSLRRLFPQRQRESCAGAHVSE